MRSEINSEIWYILRVWLVEGLVIWFSHFVKAFTYVSSPQQMAFNCVIKSIYSLDYQVEYILWTTNHENPDRFCHLNIFLVNISCRIGDRNENINIPYFSLSSVTEIHHRLIYEFYRFSEYNGERMALLRAHAELVCCVLKPRTVSKLYILSTESIISLLLLFGAFWPHRIGIYVYLALMY